MSLENCFIVLALDVSGSWGKTSRKEVMDEFLVPEVFDGDTTSLDGESRGCALFGLFGDAELFIAGEDAGTVLYKSRKTANNPVDGKYSRIFSRCILGSRGGYSQ